YPLDLYWLAGRPVDVPNVGAARDDTETRARALVEEVHEELGDSAVPGVGNLAAELVVSAGPAARALLDRAAGADLLVVGSRGRGAVRSWAPWRCTASRTPPAPSWWCTRE